MTFVNGPADPTADPPVHAVISVAANHGTGNPGHIALTVVSSTPNLTACVLGPVLLLGEQVTCDWSGPPKVGGSAQIVVTIRTSDDAVGVWLVNSYLETKSGGTDSSSGTQFQVTKPLPTTTNPPPIVDPSVEAVPNFAG